MIVVDVSREGSLRNLSPALIGGGGAVIAVAEQWASDSGFLGSANR